MEVRLRPETESRLQELSARTGRSPDQLVEDAMTAYLEELSRLGDTLDGRYDEVKQGRVAPANGEAFFERLREREEKLHRRSSK